MGLWLVMCVVSYVFSGTQCVHYTDSINFRRQKTIKNKTKIVENSYFGSF
jgi:hypothetical protein